MRTLGNIIWFIFGGWIAGLTWLLTGVLFYITIVGIPIGKACFQYAKLMSFPFGKVIVKETTIKGEENVSAVRRFFGTLVNIIWLPVGVIKFIGAIGNIIIHCITIIGIPGAVVIAKSCKFLLWPVGTKVITKEEYQAILTAQAIKNTDGVQVNQLTEIQSGDIKPEDTKVVALVLGILSIIFNLVIGIIGLILGIAGVVYGRKAIKIEKSKMGMAGLVCSIIGIALYVVLLLFNTFFLLKQFL